MSLAKDWSMHSLKSVALSVSLIGICSQMSYNESCQWSLRSRNIPSHWSALEVRLAPGKRLEKLASNSICNNCISCIDLIFSWHLSDYSYRIFVFYGTPSTWRIKLPPQLLKKNIQKVLETIQRYLEPNTKVDFRLHIKHIRFLIQIL